MGHIFQVSVKFDLESIHLTEPKWLADLLFKTQVKEILCIDFIRIYYLCLYRKEPRLCFQNLKDNVMMKDSAMMKISFNGKSNQYED